MLNYIGDLRMFSVGYVPYGWLVCDGSQFPKNGRYRDLGAIIKNIYGGDANNFKVPDLRGKAPMGMGMFQNVMYVQGIKGGASGTVLTAANIPLHSHVINVTSTFINAASPQGNLLAQTGSATELGSLNFGSGAEMQYANMDANMVSSSGAPAPVTNIQPVIGLLFAIAFDGIYPSRP